MRKKLSAIRVVSQEDIHKRGLFNALLLGTEILVSPEWIKTQLVPASDVREGDEILPNNICFGIGHLVEHLAHSEVLKSNRYSSKESFLNSRIEAESRAFIAGWNFAMKAAIAQNKGVFLKDKQVGEFLINLRYRVFFIRAMRLSNGQSIVFSPSGLLKDDSHNIQALTNVIEESEMADIE